MIVEGSDLYGDGVNVAARLEAMAEPGGICVSDDAHRQVRDKLDIAFEDDGEHQLRNLPALAHLPCEGWHDAPCAAAKPRPA